MSLAQIKALLGDVAVWEPIDERLARQPTNDLGNAERLRARHGDDLLYVDGLGWMVWDGRHFARDGGDAGAERLAHDTARAIKGEARALESILARELAGSLPGSAAPRLSEVLGELGVAKTEANDIAKPVLRLFNFGVDSGNANRTRAMLSQAVPYCRVAPDQVDAHAYLFNAGNVTLDLDWRPDREPPPGEARQGRTAARADARDASPEAAPARGMTGDDVDAAAIDPVHARPFARADRLTRIAGADHDPDAQAPHWQAFLARILPDIEIRTFLQRWFGYCLTATTAEQVFCVFYGTGANGKSTLVETIAHVMGDYAATADVTTFLHNDRRGGGDATPDLARLPGVRLVTAAEPNAGDRLSEKQVKTITGGEMILARHLHQDFFAFTPHFKLILSCNQKPGIRGQDKGIWRRVLLVPFLETIPTQEMDRDLPAKLKREAAGILNWMLDGYRLWRERGLGVPDAVRAATEDYRSETDPAGEFLTTCLIASPGRNVQAKRLFDIYASWCRLNGFEPISSTAFGRKAGQVWRKDRVGVVVYRDVEVAPEVLDVVDPLPTGGGGHD